MVSAQAPTYEAIPDPGDVYIIPPDTDIGIPVPPGGGDTLLDEDVRVFFVKQLVTADAPGHRPALCAVSKWPYTSYTELIADGQPPDGTYTWGFNPALHDSTVNYSSSTTGLEQRTTVKYTWEGIDSDTVQSEYIRVFDAELTFDGQCTDRNDTLEEQPGFFLAKGSGRKHLALSFDPADPNAVMPSCQNHHFQKAQPHLPPPPYRAELGVGPHVSI